MFMVLKREDNSAMCTSATRTTWEGRMGITTVLILEIAVPPACAGMLVSVGIGAFALILWWLGARKDTFDRRIDYEGGIGEMKKI